MLDLLTDRLIRVAHVDGSMQSLSLPAVYEAMVKDSVAAFPALRPHQRHAWHAFMAQLAVLAMVRAGETNPPGGEGEWRELLRALTPGFPDDEPWCLLVEDLRSPAFMQCAAPGGLGAYKRSRTTPDDLDLLATAKNHDVKSAIASDAEPDDWLFALIDVQTMSGYLGAGNHGIARMNGGYSSRPCLGLAPAEGGLGAHLVHDIGRMIDQRNALLDDYEDYFEPDDGVALLWLEPWDGTQSLGLTDIDPHFIEICRRVRLMRRGDSIVALTATSKKPRVAARAAKGNVGDHWTPVDVKDEKALSVSRVGFRYDRLAKLVLDEKAFRHPRAMTVDASKGGSWRLVARAVAAGQGKTEGYHERTDIVFNPVVTRSLLGGGGGRDTLDSLANAQIDEIKEVVAALRFGIAIAASGGKDATALGKADREMAYPYLRRLDGVADAHFFGSLQERFQSLRTLSEAGPYEQQAAARRAFARRLIQHATALLHEAIETVPCPKIHRYRARARATSAFWWRLRRADSVFSDQEDIFDSSKQGEGHAS